MKVVPSSRRLGPCQGPSGSAVERIGSGGSDRTTEWDPATAEASSISRVVNDVGVTFRAKNLTYSSADRWWWLGLTSLRKVVTVGGQCSLARACVPRWNRLAVTWEPIVVSVHMVSTVDHIWPLKACGRSPQQTSFHSLKHGTSRMPTPHQVPLFLFGNLSARIQSDCDLNNILVSTRCPAPVQEPLPVPLDWHL